ncbi:MAG: hypothetical protein RMK18_02185 [Armatimonadota bacterium]|nr:hypothetical protein [Armatimonadota bacterium]MCX7777251.1 hypothetical protein [Armatimonadota bacterium]MDW8024666.1 hypothetical protein [Armatimonadota bacterium]
MRKDQIKHLEFVEPANLKKADKITSTQRRLAIVLDGVKDGKQIKLGIAALEEGLLGTPHIVLSLRSARQSKLRLKLWQRLITSWRS